MLVHHVGGRSRAFRLGTLLVLVLATLAISAHVTHFHPQGEAPSATHCVLCSGEGVPLPVLAIVLAWSGEATSMLEPLAVAGAQPSAKGSNLCVRPPPFYKSS